MQNKSRAFTLIELLVVVLIIGILAAVAVPQYQKAVEKSRAMQGLAMLKNVYEAAEVYYLANGTWPTQLDELDVQIPWTGNAGWTAGAIDQRSNGKWSVCLMSNGISVGRLSGAGPYAGTGFYMFHHYDYSDSVPLRTPICAERKGADATTNSFAGEAGDFCQKLMNGTLVFNGGSQLHYYKLP